MEKFKIFFCDQKKDCNTSTRCGVECLFTRDHAHAVPYLEYDEATGTHRPPEEDRARQCRDCLNFVYSRPIGLGRCTLHDDVGEYARSKNGKACQSFESIREGIT
jgi:hypothetical protein